MPKQTKYPRLRTHVRKSASGKLRVYYVYDQRPGKDIPLGSDWTEALRLWDELRQGKPRIEGTIEQAFQAWEAEKLPTYANEGTRRTYRQNLATLRSNGVGKATWDGVRFSDLAGYLDKRSAKTQANREMSLLRVVWNFARRKGLTEVPWPAAGMERSRWKNKETPRTFEVTDALFAAVYSHADQLLRDAMDLSTATGLRLTDCRKVLMPTDGTLTVTASKTSKRLIFDVTASAVLMRLAYSRTAIKARHLMLLSTPDGKPVTMQMLRSRWDKAREKAAAAHPDLAEQIRAMYLRDMRSRAADLAGGLAEASRLLQHSSERVTSMHYRTRAERVKPVR